MTNILMGTVALGLIWAMTTLGVYITYRVLHIADLSVEGTIVLGAAVAAAILQRGGSPITATIAALAAGLLAGLLTGLLHVALRIPALLAGILCMIALYSINIRVMGGTSNLSLLRVATLFAVPVTLAWSKNAYTILVGGAWIGLAVVLLYWFLHTEIGCALRCTGSSPAMARAQGIHTGGAKLLGYMLANGLVGLSGGLMAQYQGFADVQMGNGAIVIALASLIIGEVMFTRGNSIFSGLLAMVLGAVAYRLVIALVLEWGMPASDLKLFTAITVAVALYLPTMKETLKSRRKSSKGGVPYAAN